MQSGANRRAGRAERPSVVVLSSESALDAAIYRDYCILRAHSALEAAAEMLAAPVAALIVDLQFIPRRHLRLLKIARRLGVPTIGIGNVPAGLSTDQLDGLRLAGTHSLLRVLGELSHETPNAPVTPPETLQPKDHASGESEAGDADRPSTDASVTEKKRNFDETMRVLATRSMLRGLYVSESPEPATEANERKPLPPEQVDASDARDEPGSTRDPRDLLTPQELSALLEKTR